MFHLLALISCNPASEAASSKQVAPIPEADVDAEQPASVAVRYPSDALVTRECFGRQVAEKRSYPKSAPAKPSSTASTASSTSTRQNAPSPVAAASPAPSATPVPTGGVASGYGSGPGAIGGGGVAQSESGGADLGARGRSGGTADKKAKAPAEPAPMMDAVASSDGYDAPEAEEAAAAPARRPAEKQKDEARSERKGDASHRDPADRDDESPYVREQPDLDWGAQVWLSNDDSMSLASAQRLLWAVQNRGPVQTSQVRPHEFLNYFSFDTEPVRRGDLFSVKGSARQTDADTLSLALAVKGGTPPREPLDLTVVLDRSGSMSAEGRMDYLKRGLHKMEENLRPGDRVDFVLFDDQVCAPLENFVVGRDDPALLTDTISALQPRGSTDLDLGLRTGYRIANGHGDDDQRNRRMLLISDALLNTGEIDPGTVSEVAKAYESHDIRLTAVGVGREFNDQVLDQLTEKGKGAYVFLGSEAVVDRIFGVGFDSLTRTIAHDVRFQVDLPDSLAMARFYGEEASTRKEDVQPIHYYAGTSQLFLQDLKLRDGRVRRGDRVKLTIEYTDAENGKRESYTWSEDLGALVDADAHNLDKGRALMAWTDLILARSMGAQPCGQPFSTWQDRVEGLGDDAEITWLDGLTSPLCGGEPVARRVPTSSGVAYKVKVDSDLPIAEVTLACGGYRQSTALSGSDTVARFTQAKPGSCTLTLEGNVPMQARVEVPKVGGEARCMVRGGRVSCS